MSGHHGGAERPLARDREAFFALHAERAELYEGLADAYLQPLHAGQGARVLGALRALAAAPAGTRMLWAVSDSGQYPVLIGRGLLAQGGFAALQPASAEVEYATRDVAYEAPRLRQSA